MLKIITPGDYRMGNAMFINIGCSIIGRNNNLKVSYPKKSYTDSMNIQLHENGQILDNLINLDDSNILTALSNDFPSNQGIIFNGFFQLREFIEQYEDDIRSYFSETPKERITDEVFCTVRLGDEKHVNPGYDYYHDALTQCACDKGYISSDEPNSFLVKELSKEFNLKIMTEGGDHKMKFARRFDNIVLSHGTYSWWIGFLSEGKNIIYPKIKQEYAWHGDIFCNPQWIALEYKL